MATNLKLDDSLLQKALKVSGKKTKKAAVTEALNEYIQRRAQQGILKLFGKIEYDPSFDYKKSRNQS